MTEPKDCRLVEKALAKAFTAHLGQDRKYGGGPYIIHPIRVATAYARRKDSQAEWTAVALLHDVIEDTGVTYGELLKEFGSVVADAVRAMTNPSKRKEGLSRAEKKALDREHLAGQSREVRLIKLLDRIDNLGDLSEAPAEFQRVYAGESKLLAEAIGNDEPALKSELLALTGQEG